MDFRERSVQQWAKAVQARQVSAQEMVKASLAAIAAHKELNAFVATNPERALAEAADIDAAVAKGENVGPLAGIPVGVKDLEDAAGFVTSHGSLLCANNLPATQDSILVERLRAAGCIIIGKTNTPEFGWTGDTYNPVFGATGNPWNLNRSPGGSSGGSAAALSAGLVPLCTASDGGGSMRIPAAACGFSGFKSSLGRIPAAGISRLWPITTYGPMALRIADVAFVFDVVMGPSARDLNSLPHPKRLWSQSIQNTWQPHKALWCPSPDGGPADAELVTICETAVAQMEAVGVAVEVHDEPLFEDPIWEYVLLSSLAMGNELKDLTEADVAKITPGLRSYLGLGTKPELNNIIAAIEKFYDMAETLNKHFADVDLLLTPTVAGHFPESGGKGHINGSATDAWVRHTYPYNLCRLPAASVRAGFTADKMPVGLQLVGPYLADEQVLGAIAFCENLFAPPIWPKVS